jgi:hypothetical protein
LPFVSAASGCDGKSGDAGDMLHPQGPADDLAGAITCVDCLPDLGGVVADLAGSRPPPGCTPACTSQQVCSNGQCVPLPSTCPCPPGSYCDLSTNSCKSGCVSDTDCGTGTYCDQTSRQCLPGCAKSTDCSNITDSCVNHSCLNECNCTPGSCKVTSCVHGQCQGETQAPAGTLCPGPNHCTGGVCDASGICQPVPSPAGVVCSPATSCRTAGTCDGSGHCQYTALADGLNCDDYPYHYCLSGGCEHNWMYCDSWTDATDTRQCLVSSANAQNASFAGNACSCASSTTMQTPQGTYNCDVCLTASGVTVTDSGTRVVCRNGIL